MSLLFSSWYRKVREKNTVLVLLSIGLAAGLLLVPLPGTWRGLWQSKGFDLGHVPLFAGLTLVFWRWLGPHLTKPVVAACAFAGMAELLQEYVGRSGDVGDFLRGVLASLAAAAGIAGWQRRRRLWHAVGCLLLLAGLLAWPLYDTVPYLVDACEGAQAFPILADFRSARELLRWRWRQADLTRVSHDGAWAGRLDFFPGPEPYSYGALRPIRRDLSAYHSLCCSFTVADEPLELVISLRSGSGDPGETTHYQESRLYAPGKHLIRLSLPAIAPKANPRPLDLADVWIIQFFLDQPQRMRTIYLHRIWLEASPVRRQ